LQSPNIIEMKNCIKADKPIKTLGFIAFKVVAYGDSEDWRDYGADKIIKEVIENEQLENGSIVLMHNGSKYTTD
jgi:hypothetical protein